MKSPMKTPLLSLAIILSACGAPTGTFVVVEFQRGSAPADTTHIDLAVMLAGQMATVPIENADKTPIDFPKTKDLDVANGSGMLSLVAVARNAAGAEVAHGEAQLDLARGTTVTATISFTVDATKPTLTVMSENHGVGSGFVVVNPLGRNCSNTTCMYDFTLGDSVDLVATPGNNSQFLGWTGDCTGTAACTLTMDGAKQVGAVFAAFELTVAVTGTGTVAFDTPVAVCPPNCTQTYGGASQTVTLTPTPGAGQAFGGFSGACTGFTPCTLLMDATKTVNAAFGTARTLQITKAGAGQGVVASDDGGIDCGSACNHDYVNGTMVTLTATPISGHTFGGFSPSASCVTMTANTCVLTMDAAKTMTATFNVMGIDLTIDAMTCTPSTLDDFNASNFSCQITVKNLGDTAAPATSLQLFASRDDQRSSSDTSITSCSVGAIASGASLVVTCNGNWSRNLFGPVYLVAAVDPNNSVGEASETNNNKAFAVTSLSDNNPQVVATGLVCTPVAGNAASNISCMFTVFNATENQAVPKNGSSMKSVLRLSTDPNFNNADIQIGTCTPDLSFSNTIPAATSKVLTCTGTIPAGQAAGSQVYIVGHFNSQGSSQSDRDSSDNYIGVPFTVTVPGVIDLKVQTLTCAPAAQPSAAVSCTVGVVNVGELTAAPFAVDLRFSADTTIDATDTLLGTCNIASALQAGQSATVTCTGTVPSTAPVSASQLGVILDRAAVNADANLANNTASSVLRIGPDIVVSGLSCTAAARNSATSCTVALVNQGSDTTPAFSNQLRWSTDSTIDTTDATLGVPCNALAMAPGATQTITCSGNVPNVAIGQYYIGVIADSTAAVTEAIETNNTLSRSYSVGPDLYLGYPTCTSSAARGAAASCSGTAYNGGSEATTATVNAALLLSVDYVIDLTDTVIGNCSVPVIPAGSSAAFTCNGTVPAGATVGSQYIGVSVDTANAVSEVNETNNNSSYNYITIN